MWLQVRRWVPAQVYPSAPRAGWWTCNQQILDKCNAFVSKAEQKEQEKRDTKERKRIKWEKEEEVARVKKEREDFESQMGQRLENRLAPRYEAIMGKRVASTNTTNNEVCRLQRKNEELWTKYGIQEQMSTTYMVDRFQKENDKLRKQEVKLKLKMEGDLAVIRWEILGLKEHWESEGKSELMKQIEDPRAEMEALRRQNEEMEEVAQLWRSKALRPENKQGSINIMTPMNERHATIRFGLTIIPEETRKLRAVVEELQERLQCGLKERMALAKAKRLEAEVEVTGLRETMECLSMDQAGCCSPHERGTNLKEKVEEAVNTGFRIGRKGKVKMTPGQMPRQVAVPGRSTIGLPSSSRKGRDFGRSRNGVLSHCARKQALSSKQLMLL
ncbi:hypothetical protein CBR_g23658 [Chara braunii]|uniref:Uncharacterized protein n=1 Tax=Chara braunii TaxID=69332 RepID=A0A388L4V3_CHABU|nr:hypothetical protein CBR_g23658 [Chara braunii]|eukprot:GBG77327.1 hypothetical protein CBR_g23658 [Chara braunii]